MSLFDIEHFVADSQPNFPHYGCNSRDANVACLFFEIFEEGNSEEL